MKTLLELLPDLSLPTDLSSVFEDVICDKVFKSREMREVVFSVISPRLIDYDHIKKMGDEIRRQIFKSRASVDISVSYDISPEKTPEVIIKEYRDSMLKELLDEGILLHSSFKTAELSFEGEDKLCIAQENNPVFRSCSKPLAAYLQDFFKYRFGKEIGIEFRWKENGSSGGEAVKKALEEELRLISAQYEKALEERAAELASGEGASGNKKGYKRRPSGKDVFYGRGFEGADIDICDIKDAIGEVIVRGRVFDLEERRTKNEKTVFTFSITDNTDSIRAKIFVKEDDTKAIREKLKDGAFVRINGQVLYDDYEHDIMLRSVKGIKRIEDFGSSRQDDSPKKRVELHCHTNMSDMDAIAGCSEIIDLALSWGHEAIAITDHGVVQAFPEADHASRGKDIKIIYGCEGYLVDDTKEIVCRPDDRGFDSPFTVFDIETTGFSATGDSIIEIGAVRIEGGEKKDSFSSFVKPKKPIPPHIEKLTGITNSMTEDAPDLEDVLPAFLDFCKGSVLVAHNADFDTGFIKEKCRELSLEYDFSHIDTLAAARSFLKGLKNYRLDTVVEAVGCKLFGHHRAVNDAAATADAFIKFIDIFKDQGIDTLRELNENRSPDPEAIKRMRSNHVILLAKNDIGRINLYRLVSLSHLDYFSRYPRIPKSLIEKYREGLIVGSACEAGELYRAVMEGRSQDEIERIVGFYDYLEIQPTGNNEFLIREENSSISSVEDLREINREIVALGEKFGKPVCATGDVHFINPEDEVFRRIIMSNKGFEDADNQPPLYMRTTEEMLEEFSYLGEEKAEEVVITNTNMIADMIDRIRPVRPDRCPPIIDDSDRLLREACYDKAKEIYGDELPPQVVDRLERELGSIISNNFAVMYITARRLVRKSVEDGYLVGSRGSVGSSLVAYLAGITEVNSLQAHYICPECHYVDFDSDYVKSFSGRSGCDMEDRLCPVCGKPLIKEGHDIPFETFLGFKGDKEPDIDLNFSGEYQGRAHAYTEMIFGKGKTFRAGTIGTMADKTAFGYTKHYFEEHELHKRSCEVKRLALGCVGVKRTTGQHPGGIIVLPQDEEIYSFTPVQHPANDQNTNIITTHFEYHSIDHNLLKLDILGHDDPSMIRMLEDLTGVDATTLPLDDEKVRSLFRGLSALGIEPEDIGGTDLGSLGIPEFGTDFAMQMLKDTKPEAFSDLVRIAGLAHGTDVWVGNAQTLIKEGKAKISTAICTRDDIMIYLIDRGLEKGESFQIMESVRKGKGLKPEWEEHMKEHQVPDWYIWSCKKIKYMFPKAHAVAYVMMGFRIAWFKIYEPLAFYAAFFTIRATAFDYRLMYIEKEQLSARISAYKEVQDLAKRDKKAGDLSQKEKDTLRDMRIVQEFYARGFDFVPIDLYRSDSRAFRIEDGKLLPPFMSIEGMGLVAAESLMNAAGEEPFLSRDDIKQRTKLGQSVLDTMDELGILGDMPESNQLSIFDIV